MDGEREGIERERKGGRQMDGERGYREREKGRKTDGGRERRKYWRILK